MGVFEFIEKSLSVIMIGCKVHEIKTYRTYSY